MNLYKFIRPLIFCLDEEKAHEVAISLLKKNLVPSLTPNFSDKILESKVWDIDFPNPVGLAAGFDKNAEVIKPLFDFGFGFLEVGTVTPIPQTGNPKKRLFRLSQDKAIINRLGFNNKGCREYLKRLKKWQVYRDQNKIGGIVGANIGKNKNSADTVNDYVWLLKKVYGLSDYITINVSSPNTPGLRSLQRRVELNELLSQIADEAKQLAMAKSKKIPLLLKIAPDLTEEERNDIAEVVMELKIDGLIVSNTSTNEKIRLDLMSQHRDEAGGLSGQPIFLQSTGVLKSMYKLTKGTIPIIGVGGIFTGDDAYAKIRAGASVVQVYTSLIYEGFSVVNKINKRLAYLLKRDGFSNVSEAVGIDNHRL